MYFIYYLITRRYIVSVKLLNYGIFYEGYNVITSCRQSSLGSLIFIFMLYMSMYEILYAIIYIYVFKIVTDIDLSP